MSNLLDNSPDTHKSESAAQVQDLPVAATLSDVTFVHAKGVVALDHVSLSIPVLVVQTVRASQLLPRFSLALPRLTRERLPF